MSFSFPSEPVHLCTVNSGGRCFTCLRKVGGNRGSEASTSTSSSILSLKPLHDLIKLDYSAEGQLYKSPWARILLQMALQEQDGFEALFCSRGCAATISEFNQGVETLKKIKEEMLLTVGTIHEIIVKSNDADGAAQLSRSISEVGNHFIKSAIDLALTDALRLEIAKCGDNLPDSIIPKPIYFQLENGERKRIEAESRDSSEALGPATPLVGISKCFMCISNLPGEPQEYKREDSPLLTSLKDLLWILNLNMDEVLRGAFHLPEWMEQQNGEGRAWMQPQARNIKVALCGTCQPLPKRISSLRKDVTKILLRMDEILDEIRGKIVESSGDQSLQTAYFKDTRGDLASAGFSVIVDWLRRETANKCFLTMFSESSLPPVLTPSVPVEKVKSRARKHASENSGGKKSRHGDSAAPSQSGTGQRNRSASPAMRRT